MYVVSSVSSVNDSVDMVQALQLSGQASQPSIAMLYE